MDASRGIEALKTFEESFEEYIKDLPEEVQKRIKERSLSANEATKLMSDLEHTRSKTAAQTYEYRSRHHKANQNFANDLQVLLGYLDSFIQRIKASVTQV